MEPVYYLLGYHLVIYFEGLDKSFSELGAQVAECSVTRLTANRKVRDLLPEYIAYLLVHVHFSGTAVAHVMCLTKCYGA